MVNIKIVCVGKIKEKYHRDEIDEYLKRLSRFSKCQSVEVDEEKLKDNASIKEEEMVLFKEGQRLLSQIREDEYVFLLDLHGKEISSEDFARKMDDRFYIIDRGTHVADGQMSSLGEDLIKRYLTV